MALFRISYKFNLASTVNTGWSENFWLEATTVTNAEGVAKGLMNPLLALHGAQVVCNKIAMAYVPKQRKIKGVSFPTAAPLDATDVTNADYPTTALLISMTNNAGAYTQQWIKGIPDANVANAGRYNPVNNYNTLYGNLRAMLTDPLSGWRMYMQDPAILPVPVRSIDPTIGLVTAPAHGYPVNTTVSARISGIKTVPDLNGIQSLFVVSADTLQYNVWTALTGVVIQGPKMTVTLQSKIVSAINFTKIERITKKNVGRPTVSVSGRRRRRRRA